MAHKLTKAELKTFDDLLASLEEAKTELNEFLSERMEELQESFDRKSDQWKQSEKGEAASDVICGMSALSDNLEQLDLSADDIRGPV